MSNNKSRIFAIAAGGTGGHLFPALALARELKGRGHKVLLFSDERARSYGHDMPVDEIFIIPAASIASLQPHKLFPALFALARGCYLSWKLMGNKNISAMTGFGGYPTLPPLYGARLRGIPVVLHEANAVMGRANRLAAGFASAVAGSFEKLKYLPAAAIKKYTITGNPVRDAVIEMRKASYKAPEMNEAFELLVFGGSQGARAFSDIIPDALGSLGREYKARLQIVQQCRPEDVARVEKTYQRAGIKAEISHFFNDMPKRIAKAHLIICRAGASTVSEIACIGRPAILVPFPHAIDQDQKANAKLLDDAGGGWLWEEKDLTPAELCRRITELMNSPHALEKTARNARKAARPDAASRLADLVEKHRKHGDVKP